MDAPWLCSLLAATGLNLRLASEEGGRDASPPSNFQRHGLARRFHHGLLGPNSGLVVELVLFQQKRARKGRDESERNEEDSDQEEKAI